MKKDTSKDLDAIFDPTSASFPYMQAILDAIPHGILVSDDKGIVCYANKHYFSSVKKEAQQNVYAKRLKIHELTSTPLSYDVLESGEAQYGYVKIDKQGNSYSCDVVPIRVDGEIIGTVGYGWERTIRDLKIENRNLSKKNRRLSSQVKAAYSARYTIDDFLGKSEKTLKVKRDVLKMAKTDADILILGESGTGKEVLSQAIHNASKRAGEKFVAINCATLNHDLINSEMFGYIEGAFTGANKGGQIGLFEVADKGTVLLDEISELDLQLQAKLLRVLEERCVRRIGGSKEIPVDIRIISLSNKNLEQLVNQGTFRADLYYRLNVMSVEIPALRYRRDDIAAIAEHILSENGSRHDRDFTFAREVLRIFEHYDWPGNVRELKNAVQYAANMCTNGMINVSDLPQWLRQNKRSSSIAPKSRLSLKAHLAQAEQELIMSMLEEYGTSTESKKMIAEKLEISLSSLYNKLNHMYQT